MNDKSKEVPQMDDATWRAIYNREYDLAISMLWRMRYGHTHYESGQDPQGNALADAMKELIARHICSRVNPDGALKQFVDDLQEACEKRIEESNQRSVKVAEMNEGSHQVH